MEQQWSDYRQDLIRLSDSLGEGIERKWTHELRKKILLLLRKLKNISRQLGNLDLEAELVAVEVTLGYGTKVESELDRSMIEDHQIRLLELTEVQRNISSPSVSNEITAEETAVDDGSAIQLILCNCPGRDAARDLAHGLVKSRLAACVNIIANISSIYWWQGEIKNTSECQLQIKTATQSYQDVIEFIKQNHPDEVPEILIIPVDKGNQEYFDWVKRETNENQ